MEKALQLVFSQQVREVTADTQARKVPVLRPACVETPASHEHSSSSATASLSAKPHVSFSVHEALHSTANESPLVFNSNKIASSSATPGSESNSTTSTTRTFLDVPRASKEVVSPQNSPSVLNTGANRRQVRFAGPACNNNNNTNSSSSSTASSECASAAAASPTLTTTAHVDPAAASITKPGPLLKSLAESPEVTLPNLITYDNAQRCGRAVPLLGVSDSSESLDSSADDDGEKKKLLLSDSGDSKEEKSTFFRAKPRLGEFTPLIEWLLHCGEAGEITAPTTVAADGTEKASSMLTEDYIAKLCTAATQVLAAEPTLLNLEVDTAETLVVVGDLHGQFQDLYTSVLCQQYDHRRRNPDSSDRRFLFMGDYVDRGPHSLEVVLLLLALKVEYPSLVFLTRGNHEEEKTSRVYGFLTEATSALGAAAGAAVWSAVNKVFLDLPLAALVTTPRFRFLVMHGGLSPALQTIDQIASIDRHAYNTGELSKEAHDIVDGLLWSDPAIGIGCFGPSPRGCGWSFGPAVSNNFCTKNRLNFICRAHQLAMDGYFWTHNDRVVTVFSAPNYCGINDNRGAVMVVSGNANKPSFDQYEYYEDEMEYGGGPSTDFPYSSYFC